MTERLHLQISGLVQGVGFRWFVLETAGRMGISGWVRNLANGDVEAEAQADRQVLESFLDHLRKGHPYARVKGIEKASVPSRADGKEFKIAY